MKFAARFLILQIVVLLGLNIYIAYNTFFVEKPQPEEDYSIKAVVENNNETMYEIAHVFKHLIENTSIMMRYNHYLDNHDPTVKMVPFCPECTEREDEILSIEEGKFKDLPATIEQVTRDSYEIKMAIQRIKTTLHNQKFKLKHTLDQLKDF
jgi:hypothetical protein